jgi:hypothetical protein
MSVTLVFYVLFCLHNFGTGVGAQDLPLAEHEIELMPLEILGYPQRILTSAQSYLAEVPLDWVSWQIVTLTPGK